MQTDRREGRHQLTRPAVATWGLPRLRTVAGHPGSGGGRAGNSRAVAMASVVLLGSLLLGSCTSASHPASGQSPPTSAAASGCQRVAEVLDMSPDRLADPSGYALFQIKPFSAIHTSDQVLHRALAATVTADRVIAATTSSTSAVAAATGVADRQAKVINGQCPGLGMGS